MRRFSQKNALVTLADINVTPLLDLAFVLLIIFVITTPLLEPGMKLELPRGGEEQPPPLTPRDLRRVEITPDGRYFVNQREITLDNLERLLVDEAQANRNLIVQVRADRKADWEAVAALLDRCQKRGITRIYPQMSK